MLISTATTRALDEIAMRERDVMQAYTPAAVPERSDVAKPPNALFTFDSLSVSAPSDAYFVSSDERGRVCFSRDGSFALRDGELVDGQGRPVLGYRTGASALSPLRADPVDAALGLTAGVRIEPDGSVTYARAIIDPRTGAREERRSSFGRVALARFAAGTKLHAVDATRFIAPPGIAPHFGSASDGNFGAIEPNAREGSRVDIDLGLEKLREAYLALDAVRAADSAQRGVEKTAMDLLK
ncbi:MAG: hypothetical protein ACXWNK_11340 [Vulcanimicrobiaceae bacterium]